MSSFRYRDGRLHAEDVPLQSIADGLGTPFYCYSTAALTERFHAFTDAFKNLPVTVYYSLKANSNLAVVRTFSVLGAGADVVSEGELRRALAAGIPPERIAFSGVGKAPVELVTALDEGIHQINVESLPELELLSSIASDRGLKAPVGLRINPDVNARTHEKITTGRRGHKFGIDLTDARAAYARAAKLPGIDVFGIAVHIGSQLTELDPFRRAFARLRELIEQLRADGHAVTRVDLGGGLGIVYAGESPPSPAEYAATVKDVIGPLGCEIATAPGRALVGNAGILVTRVLYIKDGGDRRIIVVDAAMNDLMRPALYGAHHEFLPNDEGGRGKASAADIVGPVCETTDTFAREREVPAVAAGDLLVIASAGAYGAVMSSTYNSRLLIPEVLVTKDRYAVVRPRPSFDEMLGQDRIPAWLREPTERQTRGAA